MRRLTLHHGFLIPCVAAMALLVSSRAFPQEGGPGTKFMEFKAEYQEALSLKNPDAQKNYITNVLSLVGYYASAPHEDHRKALEVMGAELKKFPVPENPDDGAFIKFRTGEWNGPGRQIVFSADGTWNSIPPGTGKGFWKIQRGRYFEGISKTFTDAETYTIVAMSDKGFAYMDANGKLFYEGRDYTERNEGPPDDDTKKYLAGINEQAGQLDELLQKSPGDSNGKQELRDQILDIEGWLANMRITGPHSDSESLTKLLIGKWHAENGDYFFYPDGTYTTIVKGPSTPLSPVLHWYIRHDRYYVLPYDPAKTFTIILLNENYFLYLDNGGAFHFQRRIK